MREEERGGSQTCPKREFRAERERGGRCRVDWSTARAREDHVNVNTDWDVLTTYCVAVLLCGLTSININSGL